MIPHVPSADQWDQVRTTLLWLWSFVGCMIIFAGSFLLSHGVIPSLVSTRHLSQRANSFRPVFYALSLLFLVAAVFSFVNFVTNLQVLYEIYPRKWI
ncbi:MAG: hypothetical protein IRY97_00185 [Thermomicrobiaceae bacterium]|nr:hypothetical protein [Thermomicrobiaceae bacterium]